MTVKLPRRRIFPSADEDARIADRTKDAPHCQSSSYRLAFQDPDFLLKDELRPVRLQLELLKPELALQEQGIESAVVVFGSARIPEPEIAAAQLQAARDHLRGREGDPEAQGRLKRAERMRDNSRYYEEARKLGRLIARHSDNHSLVVMTGGGPGIMEAANRGAHDEGAVSVGMNIVLPREELPNPFITPELNFQFHYFAIRKMHLLMRAKSLVAFPGGFGTLDELFETLTLIQTGKVKRLPVILFGRRFWERVVDFEFLVEEGTISAGDLELIVFADTAEEAWAVIEKAENGRGPV